MKTIFSYANQLFRQGQYAVAIHLYKQAQKEMPALSWVIQFNIDCAEKRALYEDGGTVKNQVIANIHNVQGWSLGKYSVKETNQIIEDDEHKGVLKASNDDPYFLLCANEFFAEGVGWYRIKLNIWSKRKVISTKLYLDCGSGFCEERSVLIPLVSGIADERVFHIDSPVNNIRFDPCDRLGRFKVNEFQIEPIDARAAEEIMLQRLVDRNEDFKPLTKNKALKRIKQQSAESSTDAKYFLYELYGKTFHEEKPGVVQYEDWIENVEKPSLPSPEKVQRTLMDMLHKPLISIIMPVYNTTEAYLRECIDSVLAQSYPNWELCIADDASPRSYIRPLLQVYAQQDSRIKVVYRSENGHISKASNSALAIATGEYAALLDHDDLLPEHALYFVAQAINENPGAQIFYSDEDKLDQIGKRFNPHFKSDWNPDLFFSQNYVSHLGVYQRDLLTCINGFRPGVEGSQDQDLLLRCLPHVRNDQIIHIPRVLYHWRMAEGSTALAAGEKSYTTEAGIKALRDYFAENGPSGTQIEAGLLPNTYRVCHPILDPAPLVSLLIPARDKKEITEVAVNSILDKTTYANYEIIILDNGSIEPQTLEWLEQVQRRDSRVRVLRYDQPFNFSAINNYGVQQARGSIIGLINNDVEVISPDWLTEMVSHACRPEIGCVGAKLYYSNDTLQHGGVILGIGGVAGHLHKRLVRGKYGYFSRLALIQNFSAVTAACLLVRKEIYEQVGGLDELNLKVAFNDVDFCLKVRAAGYRNLWTPWAELYHHESISRGAEDTPEKKARFAREVKFMQSKWSKQLELDPYYNPNLTRDREDFSIRNV